jgi:protein-S-isoprenylcysteine O-methyltransferase Ste14
MELSRFLMLLLRSGFYFTYALKMLLLRNRGIKTNLLGKGDKPEKMKLAESLLNLVVSLGTIVQFASAIFTGPADIPFLSAGLVLNAAGLLFFAVSVITMRDNWRAGFDEKQKTNLVTGGIYSISRNPAFVGFDLMYIGCAIVFPFWLNISAAAASLVLFHVQIKSEEKYLAKTFGKEYETYKARVCRYLGRKAA